MLCWQETCTVPHILCSVAMHFGLEIKCEPPLNTKQKPEVGIDNTVKDDQSESTKCLEIKKQVATKIEMIKLQLIFL